MDRPIRNYIEETSKFLGDCPSDIKCKLISGFHDELTEFMDSHNDGNYNMLIAQFGEPAHAAQKLLESVDIKTTAKFSHRNKKIFIASIFALLLLMIVAFLVYCYIADARKTDNDIEVRYRYYQTK